MNNITILGRLGKDVELRQSRETGKFVAKFSVGVTRKFNKDVTDWFDCVAFGKTGEIIARYFTKGNQIALQGEIQFGSYEAQNGTKRYTTTLVVNTFDFIAGNGNNTNGGNQETATTNTFDEPVYDNDMPF